MSADAPAWYATVPGFPAITVTTQEVYRWDGPGLVYETDRVSVRYDGWPGGLIAARIVPAAMLEMDKYGSRKRRVDADGDRWNVASYFKLTGKGEERARFFTVKVRKPLAVLDRLPGASEALAAMRRYRDWEARGKPHAAVPDDPARFKEAVLTEVAAALERMRQPRAPQERMP